LAVATGTFDAATLASHDADRVMEDLADHAAFRKNIEDLIG
jgi:hypothetical protein